ncbi:MAG: hypothetical protein H7239_10770 [Flavobacterium sp.]|nr:hypothetical protein [Flavobacterium sp.]
MIKNATLIVLFITLFSCKPNVKERQASSKANQPKDSAIANVDKDKNGCLASAGYIWSKVNKECVPVYTGIQLNPTDNIENEDETLSAFVLFGEDGNQAEVFLPNQQSIILTRNSKDKPWVLNDYQLISSNGYVLKKGAVTLFSGDGELGKKATHDEPTED